MADSIKILLKAQDKTKAAFRSVDQNMTKLKKSSKLMAAALGPIGAFVAGGAMLTLGKQALSSADEIQKMSKRLDISTEALSQYQHVAKLSGTNFESMAKAIAKSQRAIADADDGLSTAVRAISDMGLSVDELKKLRPEVAFEKMGAAMAAIEDPYTRASVAANVFGRAGKDLLPIFADGEAAVRAMREEADRLGLTLSQDMADSAAEANDAITTLAATFSAMTRNLTVSLAPALTKTAQFIADAFSPDNSVRLMLQLKKDDPEFYQVLKSYSDSVGLLSASFIQAQIAAHKAGEEFSIFLKPQNLVGNGLGVPNEMLRTIPEVVGPAKDLSVALTEMDAVMMNLASGNEVLAFWDGLPAAAVEAKQKIREVNNETSETAQILENEGIRASDAFGDAIVDAALRGENALQSLGNVARSIFGQILSSFIGIGVRSITAGAAPVSPDFIGPVKSLSGAGGVTNNFGDINVKANSTLNTDPMSITRLAQQLQDEMTRISKHRGAA